MPGCGTDSSPGPPRTGSRRRDRDDLVQETIAVLLQRRFVGDPERQPKEEDVRYAFGILRRQRALLIRRRLQERRLYRLAGVQPQKTETAGLGQQFGPDALADAVAMLTSEDRQIVLLRLRGVSHHRIAADLGMTSQAVRQRWIRALDELRRNIFPPSA